MGTSLITYQAHPFKIKHNNIQYMNSVVYNIQCLKCKICVSILILIMFFDSILLIIFCDICTKDIAFCYLVIIISMCMTLMGFSIYCIASRCAELWAILRINSINDATSLNIIVY